jgi:glycosyltransferase involved in cell wall biosynthesis
MNADGRGLRILFVAPFGRCQKQTAARRLLPLAAALAGRGHAVGVLIPAWDCPAEAGRAEGWRGVEVIAPALGPAPHPLADPWLLRRMLAAAKAFRPAIVHVSKGLGYAGVVGSLWLRRAGVRVILDLDDLESEAGWGAGRSRPARWLVGRQEGFLLRRAHGVSAASRVLEARAVKARGSKEGVLYLPNGLDLAPVPAAAAQNRPVALVYTRGNDISPERLRKLWSGIVAAVPQARLRVVGDWPAAPELPQSERLGWLEGEALTAALRSSALALFPVSDDARTRAKSPARLLDCLAQGLPVVTEEVGEYGILTGEAGAALAAGDDEGLVRVCVQLLLESELRRAWGRAAWEGARGQTWERRAAMVEGLYAMNAR